MQQSSPFPEQHDITSQQAADNAAVRDAGGVVIASVAATDPRIDA